MSLLDRLREAVRARLRRPSPVTLWALGVFVLALAMRLVWVAAVDSPFDNVFSDMSGYINRAQQTAYGHGDPAPMFATLYPPGAHFIYAAEMRLVGWDHHAPYLLLNCMWGAVVPPCAMLLALRVVPRLPVAVVVGVGAAIWYPVLCFSGFFSSEQPFAGAIALSAWLLVRQVESGKSTIALGVTSGVAYLVRPQIVLTLAALALVGLGLLVLRPKRAPRLRVGRLVVAGLLLTSAVGLGAYRYHQLSGRWGLISDNAAMTRLWADTDYGKVRATYQWPDGHKGDFFFESPPKNQVGEHHELYFQGYVGDPAQLEQGRRDFVKRMTAGERVERWLSNVRFLFVHNDLWPDSMHAQKGWRNTWEEACKAILLAVLCPLAILGVLSCVWRPTTVLVVCTAHVVTMILVAAFFFAEARYRVPYDVFIIVLALEGARRIVPWMAKWLRD